MVTSLKTLLKNRQDKPSKKKGSNDNSSSSANLGPEIIVESVDPEVAVDEQEAEPMTSSSMVQEVEVEGQGEKVEIELNGNGAVQGVVIVESDEDVHCGCTASLQNGLSKVKHAVDEVKHVVEEMPTEYKEAARYSGWMSISLAVLFVAIVVYRGVYHFLHPDDEGWFCSYFSKPFTPMFDALCHEDVRLFPELWAQTNRLSGEIAAGIAEFINKIFDGFHACGTIFWALFGGIYETLHSGLHELTENVTENVSFLVKFCIDFVFLIFHIFLNTISGCCDHLNNALASFRELLIGQ